MCTYVGTEKVLLWIGLCPLDTDLDLQEEDARDLLIDKNLHIVVDLPLLVMMAIIAVGILRCITETILNGIITDTRMNIDIVNGSILTGKLSQGKEGS
jgi:hypothetical protein